MFYYESTNGLYSAESLMFADDIRAISEEEYLCRLESAKQKRVKGLPVENSEDW